MARGVSAGQTRELDTILIENPRVGAFEIFNSVSITNDFTRPAEAGFEVGNDASYNELTREAIAMGAPFVVWVNNRRHMTGRVELTSAPFTPDQGSPMQFTVRTKLADAMYCSAMPSVRVSKGTTIRDFILEVFKPLGYTEADFIYFADWSRDLMTGVSSDGSQSPVSLDDIKEEQLKVNPPETIYAAADRILKRHGLMLWDSPDGRITIGAPLDTQPPLYHFRMFNDHRSAQNNVLSATRSRDFSSAPAWLGVFGTGGQKDWRKSKVGHVAELQEVSKIQNDDGTPTFWRPVLLVNEGVKTDELAERYSHRELTNRSKSVDAWEVEVDGLSYWTGSERIPYAIDTVATVQSSLAGGPAGNYLVISVTKTRNATDGDKCRLKLLKQGLWRL